MNLYFNLNKIRWWKKNIVNSQNFYFKHKIITCSLPEVGIADGWLCCGTADAWIERISQNMLNMVRLY